MEQKRTAFNFLCEGKEKIHHRPPFLPRNLGSRMPSAKPGRARYKPLDQKKIHKKSKMLKMLENPVNSVKKNYLKKIVSPAGEVRTPSPTPGMPFRFQPFH